MVRVERIEDKGDLVALVVWDTDYAEGVFFPTQEKEPFQIGLHKQLKGKLISAHRHYPISFENLKFSEFFYVVKGKVKISIFNKENIKVKDIVVGGGNIVYLLEGHSMEFLEETTLFELKQGPYRGKEKDKEMI